MKLLHKIWTGIKFGFWVIKHSDIFSNNMFVMLNELLQLILKVSYEDRHYMTEIVVTNQVTKVKQPIVHIWVGAGINAEPHKRIRELIEENEAPKRQLQENKETK